MLAADGVLGLVLLGIWIYAIFDVIGSDPDEVRNLPKLAWVVVVLLLVEIGAIAWLLLGRPQKWRAVKPPPARFVPVGDLDGPRPPVVDDPNLSGMSDLVREREERARLRMWEAQVRRREEELQRREEELRRRETE